MPGTTTNFGWPKPLSTDLIAQGADTIGQALDRADAQFFVPVDTYTADTVWSSWPLGISIMRNAVASAGNWPTAGGTSGTVITMRTNVAAHQFYMTGSPISLFWRWYGSTPGPWQWIAGAPVPTASAAGNVVPTLTANQVTAVVVTFPANRFTSNPRTFTQLLSATPQNQAIGTAGLSTSSITLNVWSTVAASPTIHWYAVQGAT
jgi:hypothetical protein